MLIKESVKLLFGESWDAKNFNIQEFPEFENHTFVNFFYDKKSGLKGFIAIHRASAERPAFGATRMLQYPSEAEALKDALRLSHLMSYKSALAGLPYGGGKAVLIGSPKTLAQKKKMLAAYAACVHLLRGSFITGADVGLTQDDVRQMRTITPFMVGVKGDPAFYTAVGVFAAIQVCLREVFGSEMIRGRSFAIQGLGKIGMGVLKRIYKDAGKIYVSEVNPLILKAAKKKYPKIHIVSPADIHKQKVDVFSPCALSDAVTSKNISELRCKIIAGGANNQLETPSLAGKLYARGILYAPDYVVNAGGLMCVVDEYEHKNSDAKRITPKVLKIKNTLSKIFAASKKKNTSPFVIANLMAEKLVKNF
jgi:glutamate dehydrogenase/leucine dehydrogenase